MIEKSVIQASIQDGQNHIKITIKLRTIIQNCLKSSKTEVLQLRTKRAKSRRIGGAQARTGLVLHSRVAVKSQESISAAEVVRREDSHPTRPPIPGFQWQEEKVPWLLAVETSRDCGWVRQRVLELQECLLQKSLNILPSSKSDAPSSHSY